MVTVDRKIAFASRRERERFRALNRLGFDLDGRFPNTSEVQVYDSNGRRDIPVTTQYFVDESGKRMTAFVPPSRVLRELTGRRM